MSNKLDRIRAVVLASEPDCRLCARAGVQAPAVTVAKIIPDEQGGKVTRANLQPVCARHVAATSMKSPALVRVMKRRMRERMMKQRMREFSK